MQLMALGEIGAFILGIVVAVLAFSVLSNALLPLRISGTLACWFLATKHSLRFVHWGYKPEKQT